MKHFLKIAAGITLAAAVIPATALPQSTWKASAATAGDVNNDGKFDYSDISALQAFLLGKNAQISNWQAADLDQNRTVDARDLSMLRRMEPAEEADPDPVYIHLKGNSITSEGGNVDISGKNATITHSGTYYIDGTLDGGQILVNIPDETVDSKTVKLFLNGVNMKNSSAPCIMVENAENTSVNLEPGKENVLSDGKDAPTSEVEPEFAVLHAKDDLTVKGEGSLKITAGVAYGLHCNNDLKLNGGTLDVETENGDAIRGRTSLTVKAGTINVNSEGDGIKATKGSMEILGGDITIKSSKDAVQADTTMTLSGGALTACGDRGLTAPVITLDGTTLLATATDGPCETLTKTQQNAITVALTKEWSKNNPVSLTDGSGNIVFDRNTPKKFRYGIVSTPELNSSTGYELYVGGIQVKQNGEGSFRAGTPAAYSDVNNSAKDSKLLYSGLFDKSKIHRIDVEMPSATWQEFLSHANEEVWYPCDVKIDGTVIKNVGIRTKGNSSRMFISNSGTGKYSWRLKLDKYEKLQNYYGLTELAMNNFYSDASCMRDELCYLACDEVGSYASRTSYTDMYLNGELYSFYYLLEQPGTTMAERLSETDDSVLYKATEKSSGDYCSFMSNMPLDNFSVKWGTDDQYQHIDEVKQAINKVTTSNYKFIEDVIDVPSFLQGFAVNCMLCNYDSYNGSLAHNYYLVYTNGKMYYISWDFNLCLGNFMDGGSSVNSDINSGMHSTQLSNRPLLKLLEIPEYKKMYNGYVRQIMQLYSNPEQKVAGIADQIKDHVKADPRFQFTYDQFVTNTSKSAEGLQVSSNPGGAWPGGNNPGGGWPGGGWPGGGNGGWPGGGGGGWPGGGGGWPGGGGFDFGGAKVSVVDFLIKRNEVVSSTLTGG